MARQPIAQIESTTVNDWIQRGIEWYEGRNWDPFPFQMEMMREYLAGRSGILNAPTGSGKTLALWIPILLQWMRDHPRDFRTRKNNGLIALWITPLRALSQDITTATSEACVEMELPWRVETRTGDTSSSIREKQKRNMPEGLVTTPESVHVLLSSKDHERHFKHLRVVVVDEWHELLGSKRGVQTELLIAHLRQICPDVQVWGISATIGNLAQARGVILGRHASLLDSVLVKADIHKTIEMVSVMPDEIERFPWAGHLGINMVDKVLPLITQSRTTLVFTNTRSQCELWYQALLQANPDLAGQIAMHHGAISSEIRTWVEQSLHAGLLKVVVCTSSLDLGVDFRPVDQVIQVGGPKGIARFVQRAGRSGHQPGASSRIYFVPTHSLELIEAAATREAITQGTMEDRVPIVRAYDVLVQYLMTLACGDGFIKEKVFEALLQTHCYADLSAEEFDWCLNFLVTGGHSLQAYDEYKKVTLGENGRYQVANKRAAMQHRLSIGTIVSDVNMQVTYLKGGRIGTVEESFISQLKPGDVFWFAGKTLELVKVRNLEVLVKASKQTKGKVPRWMGSRMLMSSHLAELIRSKLDDYLRGKSPDIEIQVLAPLLDLQAKRSALPHQDECLVEYIRSKEGHHLYVYPFEGRLIHEVMAALFAWRLSQMTPISFSIAMNDYGFELLSDQEIPIQEALSQGLMSTEGIEKDIAESINQTEMTSRRFREVARVAGLIFEGFPGKQMKSKHLQASTALLYQVFEQYDPENLLLQQAFREVMSYQVDINRLRLAMERIAGKRVLFTEPQRFTPFAFPIMVDRLREKLSSEKLLDRVLKMQIQLER